MFCSEIFSSPDPPPQDMSMRTFYRIVFSSTRKQRNISKYASNFASSLQLAQFKQPIDATWLCECDFNSFDSNITRAVIQSMRKDHQRKTQKHHTLVFVYNTLNNVKLYSLHDVITPYMLDSDIAFFLSPEYTFTLDQLGNKLLGKILHKSVSIS